MCKEKRAKEIPKSQAAANITMETRHLSHDNSIYPDLAERLACEREGKACLVAELSHKNERGSGNDGKAFHLFYHT
jgi:hypothetical protein